VDAILPGLPQSPLHIALTTPRLRRRLLLLRHRHHPRSLHLQRVPIERLPESRNHLLLPALLTVEPAERRGERNLAAAAASFEGWERAGDGVGFNWTGKEEAADLEGLAASGNGLERERAKRRGAFEAIDDIALGGSSDAIEGVFVKVNDGGGERAVGADGGSGNGFEASFMGFGSGSGLVSGREAEGGGGAEEAIGVGR